MSALGRKRAASSSSIENILQAKKQKTEAYINDANTMPGYAEPLPTNEAGPVELSQPSNSTPGSLVPPTPSSTGTPSSRNAGDLEEKVDAAQSNTIDKKKAKGVPVKTLFTRWKPNLPPVPKFNDAWGQKAMPGQDGPQPRSNQPPARSSNAQMNPPLWEDLKFRFKKGDRFVKSFRKGEDVDDDAAATFDQQENLVLKLIDMRPKSRKDKTPRRTPTYYIYDNGMPNDWGNKQTIKVLNDRRQQAIDRVTMDAPWTNFERKYLASLFRDFPDISILELTERFNWRFKDQDFAKSTAFDWDYISTGRTVESVRHEYLTFKHKYDEGEAPKKKELADKSRKGKDAVKDRMEKFGKPDKKLETADDESDDEGEASRPRIIAPKKLAPKEVVVDDEDVNEYAGYSTEDDCEDAYPAYGYPAYGEDFQPSENDQELLELAGYNHPEEFAMAQELGEEYRAPTIEATHAAATGDLEF